VKQLCCEAAETKQHNKSMKKMMLAAMGLSAFIALIPNQTLGQESDKKAAPKPGGSGHSHFTKIPGTVEEIWAQVHKQQERLRNTVAKKDLGEAHDHAFAIRDLVKALPSKLPEESKAKAEESAKEIAKIAGEIDKSGAAGAQKATEENVKRMDTAVKALEKTLKAKDLAK
jgi:hypothetical protein